MNRTINFKGDKILSNINLLFSFAGIIPGRYKGYDLSLNFKAPLKSGQNYGILFNINVTDFLCMSNLKSL